MYFFPHRETTSKTGELESKTEITKSPQMPMVKGFFDASSVELTKTGAKMSEGQKSL